MVVNDSNRQIMTELVQSLKDYDPELARLTVKRALSAGISPMQIFEKGLSVGIKEVGDQFALGIVFLPELLLASKAMEAGLSELRTHWKDMESERKIFGKVVLGTVKGDIHNIGKQIVASIAASAGFQVFDIGEDISEETFVEKVKELKPDILGLSALLTTSMPHQRYVIEALEEAGLREAVKVMVGGSPTTEEWGREIGADGWAPNAVLMVKEAKKLLKVE